MKLALIAFTEKGYRLAQTLGEQLGGQAHRCAADLAQWTEENFAACDALIFVGAVGIAVRAVAPYCQSKAHDPAVVVVDECAAFAVPILSGHLGGANSLARKIAVICSACPVITTATDLNGVFAVDEWAKRQGCAIANPQNIKKISGALLAGKAVKVYTDHPVSGMIPSGIVLSEESECAVEITLRVPKRDVLHLIPKIGVLGIGCKKNISLPQLDEAYCSFLSKTGIAPQCIAAAATIDLKKEEPALLDFCRNHGWQLYFYTAQQLQQAEGSFTPSDFVRQITGVDNVCERAAVLCSGGSLFAPKQAGNGVTIALAAKPFTPDWSWKDE